MTPYTVSLPGGRVLRVTADSPSGARREGARIGNVWNMDSISVRPAPAAGARSLSGTPRTM